jgi:hypothetical protein
MRADALNIESRQLAEAMTYALADLQIERKVWQRRREARLQRLQPVVWVMTTI